MTFDLISSFDVLFNAYIIKFKPTYICNPPLNPPLDQLHFNLVYNCTSVLFHHRIILARLKMICHTLCHSCILCACVFSYIKKLRWFMICVIVILAWSMCVLFFLFFFWFYVALIELYAFYLNSTKRARILFSLGVFFYFICIWVLSFSFYLLVLFLTCYTSKLHVLNLILYLQW